MMALVWVGPSFFPTPVRLLIPLAHLSPGLGFHLSLLPQTYPST
jgi:hypothetical protein